MDSAVIYRVTIGGNTVMVGMPDSTGIGLFDAARVAFTRLNASKYENSEAMRQWADDVACMGVDSVECIGIAYLDARVTASAG